MRERGWGTTNTNPANFISFLHTIRREEKWKLKMVETYIYPIHTHTMKEKVKRTYFWRPCQWTGCPIKVHTHQSASLALKQVHPPLGAVLLSRKPLGDWLHRPTTCTSSCTAPRVHQFLSFCLMTKPKPVSAEILSDRGSLPHNDSISDRPKPDVSETCGWALTMVAEWC